MEREKTSKPETEKQKSDLPTMRYGRTLKEMLASGKLEFHSLYFARSDKLFKPDEIGSAVLKS